MLSGDALRHLYEPEKESDIVDVFFCDPTYEILEWIKKDFNNINKIDPEKFENLIIAILTKKGFHITKSGKTNTADGGIDIVAQEKGIVNTIIAIQIKYKFRQNKKVNVSEVRDFLGSMEIHNFFNAGMVITNSSFSADSRWIENQKHNLELKDSNDIQKWIGENFITTKLINKEINLTKNNKIILHH